MPFREAANSIFFLNYFKQGEIPKHVNVFIVLFPIFKWNSAVCKVYRYILVEIHWSLIILHREQFGATSSFFSSVITTKSVVVCFKTHPEPGAGRVSSFISFTTRVLLRLMLYYAHLEQIVTQRLKMYVKVLLKLLFTRSEKDEY